MKLFSILLAIALPSTILAQSYKAAYVLKNNGDTLKGYVNYQEWQSTPKSIDFKQTPGSKPSIKLYPNEIKRVSFNDGLGSYISYAGPLSMDRTGYVDVPRMLDTSVRQDTVFLKVIVEGEKVSLLLNTDKIKTRLFIKETGFLPQELRYHQYYNSNGNQILTTDGYKEQLTALLQKYAPNNKEIGKLIDNDYRADIIEKIILNINGITLTANKNKITSNNKNTSYFAGVSANYNIATFNGPPRFGFTHTSTSVSPGISAGLNIYENPVVQKIIFRAAINLSFLTADFASTPADFKFSQYTAGISPQVIFNIYNTENFKYFVNIGVSVNYSIYPTNKLIVKESGVIVNPIFLQSLGETYMSYSKGSEVNNPYQLHSVWMNFAFKTGFIVSKRTEAYLMYNPSLLYSSDQNYNAKNQTLGIGINFLLNTSKTN